MSGHKNSILNYFKKTTSTPGPGSPSSQGSISSTPKSAAKSTPAPTKTPKTGLKATPKADKATPKADKATPNADKATPKTVKATTKAFDGSEDDERADMSIGCNGDGSPALKSSKTSAIRRKRIKMITSSSDESGDEYVPPKKGANLFSAGGKSNRARSSTPSTESDSEYSEVESDASEKENSVKPTKQVKRKLSEFASPVVKKMKMDNLNDSKDESNSRGEEASATDPISFAHLSYPFLDPKIIRDKERRRPDDENYDPTTLYVPDSFLQNQTPAQRQWWELKSAHYDTVLFFKMGKFYELFNMDAVLGMEKCNLLLMKREIAHCGFPEAAFQRYAEILVDLGYKVARIEQTESPAQMAERCALMSKPTKFDKVVKREVCQVSSTGSRTQSSFAESRFLSAISCEKQPGKIDIGIAFVDASIGTVHIGQFDDDSNLSRLETLLAVYPPVELLYDRTKIFPTLSHIIEKMCPNNSRAMSFPQAKKTLKMFADKDYFETRGQVPLESWPKDLVMHMDEGDSLGFTAKSESTLAVMSLGGLANYLQESLVDQFIFSMKKIVNVNPIDIERNLADKLEPPKGSTMILDQKSLKNLDVISTNGQASLFSILDKTSTAMGKRLLYTWTCMPLLRIDEIEDRQNALQFLNDRPKLVEDVRSSLKGVPDIEKLLSLIHTAGVKLPSSHPESRAVYYEQANNAKIKISRLVTCLEALNSIDNLVFTIREDLSETTSNALKNVLLVADGGNFPNMSSDLNFFSKAFNQKEALTQGKIVPKKGVDEAYDRVKESRVEFEEELADYLKGQKKFFGADVKFFGSGNQAYQLEVPEVCASRVNKEYTTSSQRKGFKRFTTMETKDFFARNQSLEEEEAIALAEVSRNIFAKFSEKKHIWDVAIKAIAQLDALMSLHEYSFGLDTELSCFPKFTQISGDQKPFLKVEEGRHPIVIATNSSLSFIPNNFELDDRLAILTGANMGGKSTLMRQTALLCVLAQMGCKVPASLMELSPIDRIFTRIGAADNIFDRESTFMVELSETSIILKHANKHSLVLVDELGRGTTTFDGCAIAHGVSKYLAKRGCRTIFSTHYHELMREYVQQKNVAIYHMGVMEQEGDDEHDSAIVFLYTVSPGPCSKSHGFNAARLAGLPEPIIDRALKIACQFENEQNNLLELAAIVN